MKEYKYNYVYQITNLLDGKIYIGKHSTDDLDDGYMGSGSKLRRAQKRDGIENFSKKILRFCDTLDDALTYEAELVDESFIKRYDTYNSILGGQNNRRY